MRNADRYAGIPAYFKLLWEPPWPPAAATDPQLGQDDSAVEEATTAHSSNGGNSDEDEQPDASAVQGNHLLSART
jgi:hypothetical protein